MQNEWMKKRGSVLLSARMLSLMLCIALIVSVCPVCAYGEDFTPNPKTEYAKTFIASCEGQQWFIDEVERLLNAQQKTLNNVTGRDDFSGIVSLGLANKGITGKIPSAIGELTQLRHVYLSGNALGGEIPAELFTLANLESVDLSGNNYGNAIPAGFGAMPALLSLNLSGNAFTGSIPDAILANTKLTFLDVSSNKLSGPVPAELNQMTGLAYLSIADNPWTAGPMPDLSALSNLQGLSAWGCGFTGDLPDSLYALKQLQVLDLADNALGGELSPAIGDLKELQLLSIGNNRIEGTVPEELSLLTKLEALDIADNRLRGKLPIAALSIPAVHAQNNYLTGDVLKDIANNEGNFCDGALSAQYELTAASPARINQTGQTNLYLLLKNAPVNGAGIPANPLLSADQYIASISNDPDGKVTLTFDADGIYAQANEEIKTAEGVTITIQIKDNDGSDYSSVEIILTTEATSGGGGGGGIPAEPAHHEPYVNGYPDGTFQPQRSISREEVSAMLVSVLGLEKAEPKEPVFTDVLPERWSAPMIASAKGSGLAAGYPDGSFQPADPMTRAELCAMLCAIAAKEGKSFTTSAMAFSDVTQDAWYFDHVMNAVRYGLATGYPDGTFRPNDAVSRAEAVTMINNLLGRDPKTAEGLASKPMPFSDVPQSHWAYLQILEAAVSHEH